MAERADVVIIGGGAIGTSTAYHLTELGITDVVIVERDTLASGSTSKASGGVRLQFGDPTNIKIGLRSMDAFETFEERLGVDIGFRQHGYLFLLDTEKQLESFRRAIALQNDLGVPSRELTAGLAADLVPQIDAEGLLGGAYCHRDGQATPEALVQGYASRAYDRGVRIRQSCSATRIDVEHGRIRGVETRKGYIETNTVMCAAGAWSRPIAAEVGVELPVEPLRQTLHFSPHDAGLPSELPLTVDVSGGVHIHREGPGLVFGGHQNHLDEVAVHAIRRFPFLEELDIQSSWWGYYEMSPDTNGIVGVAGEPEGFYFATGFSGHGFQQSPAVGEHMAELIAGREPTLDLSALGLDRFLRADLTHEELFI